VIPTRADRREALEREAPSRQSSGPTGRSLKDGETLPFICPLPPPSTTSNQLGRRVVHLFNLVDRPPRLAVDHRIDCARNKTDVRQRDALFGRMGQPIPRRTAVQFR